MLGGSLRVKPYSRRDRSALLGLIWRSQWTHENLDWHAIERWLEREGAQVYLAWGEEQLLGYIGLSPPIAGCAWIRILGLRDGLQCPWLISELWQYTQAQCIERGIDRIMILMLSDWLPACLDYCGFCYWDDIITYHYHGKHEPFQGRSLARLAVAEMEHLPAIARVDRLAFRRGFRLSPGDLRQALRAATAAAIAEYQGDIVGYQISLRGQELGHIARLAVAPSLQRQHIGAALLQRQLQAFSQSGVATISVNTQLRNLPSQRLYERFGFTRSGEDFEVWHKVLRPGKSSAAEGPDEHHLS